MQVGWFKCKSTNTAYNAKVCAHTAGSGGYRDSDFFIGYLVSTIECWFYRKRGAWSNSRLNFFIQQYLTSKKEIKEKRQRHLERMNEDVFKPWMKHKFSEDETRFVLKSTFQDLQLNIVSVLDASEKHSLAESHLESYGSAIDNIEQIRTKEKQFNYKLNKFVAEIEQSIVSAIQAVKPSFHAYSSGNNDTLCYASNNIRDYLFKCAQNIPLNLVIKNNSEPQLSELQIDQGRDFVAIADPETLQNVKIALEQLKDDIIQNVKELIQERNAVAKIYDEKLIPIVSGIISTINEEEPINGGCGLSYCPKPRVKNVQPKNPQ